MSRVSVERPSLTRPPSHQRIILDQDVEMTGFIPRPQNAVFRRMPHGPVINIDDDDSPTAGGSSSRSRTARRPQSSISLDDSERPVNRRRTTSGGRDHPVLVLDDTIEESSGSSRRTTNGGQNTPIVVFDSDEEQGQPSGSSFRSRRRIGVLRRRGGRPSVSSFRIFSPSPPPPQHHPVPPVPPLPPVIAGPMPFAFRPPSRNNAPSGQRPPFDEHPQPEGNSGGIHLGGGLLSQGNPSGRRGGSRAQAHFQRPRADEPNNGLFAPVPRDARINTRFHTFSHIRGFFHRFTGSSSTTPSSSDNAPPNHDGPTLWGDPNPPRPSLSDLDVLNMLGERTAEASFFGFGFGSRPWTPRIELPLGPGKDYDKSMTHPGRAGLGWTFDFGAEHEDEGADNVVKDDVGAEILVCAKCLDPLIANAEGMVDMNEAERKEKRVWGLRCGHVLDGKCVDVLMKPVEAAAAVHSEGEEIETKWEAKGKGRESSGFKAAADEVDALVKQHHAQDKGKSKALVIRLPAQTFKPRIDVKDRPRDLTPSEDNSIRSRLRSRHPAIAPTNPLLFSSRRSTRGVSTPSVASPSITRRRRTKSKCVGGLEEIESRHQWSCPVDGCCRSHESVKVGGVWKMDSERGAVGMFV